MRKLPINNYQLTIITLISLFIIYHSSLIIPTYAAPVDLSQEYSFGYINSLSEGLGKLITPIFDIAAIAVTFYFLIGAFKYLTSGGDKAALSSAKDMITHAIIGFIMLMMIFIILQFIPQFFGLRGFNLIGTGP